MSRGRRLLIALLVTVAAGAAVVGAVLGASQDDASEPVDGAAEPAGRSFLARIVPRPAKRERDAEPPPVPRSAAAAVRSLSLERKVAQLFLVGFEGTDLNAEVFERLRRLDLGGIVIGAQNYTTPTCSASSPARRG